MRRALSATECEGLFVFTDTGDRFPEKLREAFDIGQPPKCTKSWSRVSSPSTPFLGIRIKLCVDSILLFVVS